jgi:hypothetical protein
MPPRTKSRAQAAWPPRAPRAADVPADDGGYGPPSLIEIALAGLGLSAWLACAFETLSAVLR